MRQLSRIAAMTVLVVFSWLAAIAPEGLRATAAKVPVDQPARDVVASPSCSFLEKRGSFLAPPSNGWAAASSEATMLVAAALASTTTAPRSRSRDLDKLAKKPGQAESIDDFIFTTLSQQGIQPAPPTTDSEFLRRVTLDLTGRIPTQQEVIEFLTNASPDKRSQKIAQLLVTPQWADRWAMFFGDLYRNTIVTAQVNRYADGRDAFHLFILNSLQQNKPYDQMVREILASTGSSDGRSYPDEYATYDEFQQIISDHQTNPVQPTAAGYIVGGRTTGGPIQDTYDALASSSARDFLGISHMDCILCHDGSGHLDSLNVWGAQAKRADAWGLAAFFSKVRLTRPRRLPASPPGEPPAQARYWLVAENPRGEYRLNTTTGNRPKRQPGSDSGPAVAPAVYPFGGGTPLAGESHGTALGRLLTADKQFARATVNYIWRAFFSRGIVEPPDQFDPARLDPANPPPDPWTIQPSHPELLEFLTKQFIENEFDLKWLMGAITNSEAYQLSSRYEGTWNAAYEDDFARHQVRRLGAEELHDALVISGGLAVPYGVSQTIGAVTMAMQFPDVQFVPFAPRRSPNPYVAAASAFLDAFFRGNREETPRSSEGSILQALQMMNSPLVLARVDSSNTNTALTHIVQHPDDTVVVQALYLRVLSRSPTPEELSAGVMTLGSGNRNEKAEDLMWSLYNRIEFLFNY